MNKIISENSKTKQANQPEKLTKDEKIYQQLYDAIVDHKLAPDTKLPEDALAETFDVSRTIIRKVLLGLSHEGLVTTAPKRGARVARPSIQEAKEVFEARRVIEVATLPIVIEKIDDSKLAQLFLINDQQKAAQKVQDQKRVIKLAGVFHLELNLCSKNNSLFEYLHKLISRSSLIEAVYGSEKKYSPSCEGHSELLNLISQKEVEQSKQWMNDHLIEIEAGLDFSESEKSNPDFKEIFGS